MTPKMSKSDNENEKYLQYYEKYENEHIFTSELNMLYMTKIYIKMGMGGNR